MALAVTGLVGIGDVLPGTKATIRDMREGATGLILLLVDETAVLPFITVRLDDESGTFRDPHLFAILDAAEQDFEIR